MNVARLIFLLMLQLLFALLLFASPAQANNYRGQPISLDLQDANIVSVFQIISEVSGLNVVVSDEISGKVTIRLQDVPWDQALEIVLRQNGLYQVTEGNVMIIVPLKKVPDLYRSSVR